METIKTDTHTLLVDETAEIKEGDYMLYKSRFLDGTVKTYEDYQKADWNIQLVTLSDAPYIQRAVEGKNAQAGLKGVFKIIASSPKLGDLPEFETLPPNTEDDVEKLAYEQFKHLGNTLVTKGKKLGYVIGYKQAKSETMFSLEDIKKAWDNGNNYHRGSLIQASQFTFEKTIESLTKP